MSGNTRRIVVGVLVLVSALSGWLYLRGARRSPHETVLVQRGTIVQEVSASGKVEPPARVVLRFKSSGTLVVLNARVGQRVVAGQLLAKQDTSVLAAQLRQMQASLDEEEAKLAQLLAGTAPEDVAVAQTAVANARVSVANSRQAVEVARQSLVDKLQDAYTRGDDAIRGKADQLFNDPRGPNPQLRFLGIDGFTIDGRLETDVERGRLSLESTLRSWDQALRGTSAEGDLAAATALAKRNLDQVKSFLDNVSLVVNALPLNSFLPQAMIDQWRADISTARANANTAVANLTLASESLRKVEADVRAAEGNLATARDQLTLKRAPARVPDIALREAQIRRAQAALQQVQAQMQETVITAPLSGIVTETNGEVGEILTSESIVVSLIPAVRLRITLNVAEADVVDVRVGQEARVTLDAFGSGMEWKGAVARIDPAETVRGGAVYYKTTILFDEDTRVKPGMTAEVYIKIASRENALLVPASAIQIRNGRKSVRVLDGIRVTEKPVTTGLVDSDGMVEITSGVIERERVIVGNRT